jgi:ABC-type dipeptide/oligopeptide/nickel transport system permease component
MANYIFGRLLGIIGVLLAVSVLIFLIMHAIPGGPFDASASGKAEVPIPEHIRARLLAQYGLDQPLYVQYLRYMAGVLTGDLGVSFRTGEPVTEFLGRTWPVTLLLGILGFLIGAPIGIGMGILAALRPNSWLDYLTSSIVVLTYVTPVFVIAILLIIVFSVNLHWLPTGGWGTPQHTVLPVVVYALGIIGGLARFTRSGMVEALRADYIRTARAKGLAPRTVVLRHAFRNASLPLITMLGPIIVNALLGSFFIEAIFRIPGVGAQMTLATYNRDYPVIMAMALLWTLLLAVAYLVSDLMYSMVDPRIRLGTRIA